MPELKVKGKVKKKYPYTLKGRKAYAKALAKEKK